MANLVLLKADDVQKKWKGYDRTHGVYSLTFNAEEIKTYFDGDTQVHLKNEYIKFKTTTDIIFKSLLMGNIQTDQKEVRVLGRFVKLGKTVLFEPLTEIF